MQYSNILENVGDFGDGKTPQQESPTGKLATRRASSYLTTRCAKTSRPEGFGEDRLVDPNELHTNMAFESCKLVENPNIEATLVKSASLGSSPKLTDSFTYTYGQNDPYLMYSMSTVL